MAHVKIQYDVMDAFCMDVFQKFGYMPNLKSFLKHLFPQL